MPTPALLSRRQTLALLAALPGTGRAMAAEAPVGQPLPGRMHHQRFAVEITGADGQPACLFTSTAGGLQTTAEGGRRLGLGTRAPSASERRAAASLPWDRVVPDARVPLPADADGSLALPLQSDPDDGALPRGTIAILGAPWFAERHWRWDFATGQLLRMPEGSPLPGRADQRVPLGFRRGGPQLPRLTVSVDGEPLACLLDTGATLLTTPAARVRLGAGAAPAMGACFVAASRAQAWRQRHPDWPWLPAADRLTGPPLLQVPSVTVAGQASGPVWFAVRDDLDYGTGGLSAFTDQPVQASLGGSLLQGFTLEVDYLRAQAAFLKT